MKLWKITDPTYPGDHKYDTYDAMIVAAETEDAAKEIPPRDARWHTGDGWAKDKNGNEVWPPMQSVVAEYIGEAVAGTVAGVILESFNAG